MKNYLITGATGFIGKYYINNILNTQSNQIAENTYAPKIPNQIFVLTRNRDKANKIFNNKSIIAITNLQEIIDKKIDIIINLAGEPIADKRWSDKQKLILLKSRIDTTSQIIEFIKLNKNRPEIFISASAIGFFGSHQDELLFEESPFHDEFTHFLCKEWEEQANKARDFGVTTCITRFGIVLGKNGGALKKMLPSFKMGLGGKISSGKQFMSWIHIQDVTNAINFLISKNMSGTFNLTSPNPERNINFTIKLADELGRPHFFSVPELMIKLIFSEMGEALLSRGCRVYPKKLIDNGFKFKYEKLEDALYEIIN